MREIRQSGSEGGVADNGHPYPYPYMTGPRATDTEVFQTYVREVLVPTLRSSAPPWHKLDSIPPTRPISTPSR